MQLKQEWKWNMAAFIIRNKACQHLDNLKKLKILKDTCII